MKVLIFDSDKKRHAALRRSILALGHSETSIKPEEDSLEILRFLERSTLPEILFCSGKDGLELCKRWRTEENELLHGPMYIIYVGDKGGDFKSAVLAGADNFMVWPASKEIVESHLMMSEAKKELLAQSSFDYLTKIMNRRSLEEGVVKELERARRKEGKIGLVLMDIDDFKKVNDSFGHQVGDMVLKEVAERIRSAVRDYDYVGRYGGEEFMVIMVDCDLEDAKRRAEDLRSVISSNSFNGSDFSIALSVSVGVSVSKPQDFKDHSDIVKRVDKALYLAKNKGKNRIEIG